jgi:hypothetical protein
VKRALCAIGACVLILSGASAADASGPAGPTDATARYAGALRTAARALEVASRAHAPSVPDVHLPPAPLPGPPRYSPSLDDWLQATLRSVRQQKRPKSRAQLLRATAATLRYAIVATQTNATPPTHPVGPTLAAILANPVYHERESSTQAQVHKSWWQRFLEWLADTFARLLQGISNAAGGIPLIGQIVAVLTIGLIAGLVLLMGYRLARYVSSLRRVRTSDQTGELIEADEPPEALYARARAAAASGRYAAAVALVFRAGLLQLDVGGVIPYDAARTAGEYRRTVRRECSPAASPFDELARSFTLAAYAEAPVDERDWRTADDAYHTFTPLVAGTHPAIGGS